MFDENTSFRCSLLSPQSCAKESKQSSVIRTMDVSGKVKLHIGNIPYEMKWQELKDLLREKGESLFKILFCVYEIMNSFGKYGITDV